MMVHFNAQFTLRFLVPSLSWVNIQFYYIQCSDILDVSPICGLEGSVNDMICMLAFVFVCRDIPHKNNRIYVTSNFELV